MRTVPRSGSVLMETVLCLPLILMLLTGIVQFSRIWEARFFTKCAAYNAARAALVYNVEDYGEKNGAGNVDFFATKGPVWLAAVNTLAWKSHTSEAGSRSLPGVGTGFYPNSGEILRQVRIFPRECFEKDGVVKVTVQFDFPLLFPLFDANVLWTEKDSPPNDVEGLVFDPFSNPGHTITLTESCILPKPWATDWYPRLSKEELEYLNLQR